MAVSGRVLIQAKSRRSAPVPDSSAALVPHYWPRNLSARSQASTCPKASSCHCSGVRASRMLVSYTKRRTRSGPYPSGRSNFSAM